MTSTSDRTRSATLLIDVPPKLDYPNGYAARYYHFLHALSNKMRLRIVAIEPVLKPEDPRKQVDAASFLPDDLNFESFTWVASKDNPLNRAGLLGHLRRAAHYAFGRLPYMSHPRSLAAWGLDRPDSGSDLCLVFLPPLSHLALRTEAPTIAVLEDSWDKALYWNKESIHPLARALVIRGELHRLRILRRRLDRHLSHVIAISEAERDSFRRHLPTTPISVLPHGIDCQYFQRAPDVSEKYDFAIFGRLGSGLTLEATNEVLATAAGETTTDATSWAVVGENADRSVMVPGGVDVSVESNVDDVRPWYSQARVVLAPAGFHSPLSHRAGARTTVLQAWAMEKPLVATPFVLDGLPARDGENVLVARDAKEMLRLGKQLIDDVGLRNRIASAGRAVVVATRDIRKQAHRFAELCLAESARGTR